MSLKALGSRLKTAREGAKLTQRQVAEHFNVVVTTISRWETGDVDPGFERLEEIAALYGLELREMMFAPTSVEGVDASGAEQQ